MTTIPETHIEDGLDDSSRSVSSESQPLWTVKDTAEYLRLKPNTVRMMARNGDLPAIKVGKRLWRFRIKEVKEWLNLHS
jgi:excisionase family DNA binding protein